ncbi:glucosyltransferase [Pleosporales sp. CAS-2024a]
MSSSMYPRLKNIAKVTIPGIRKSLHHQASTLFKPFFGCSTTSLRALNVGAICLIYLLSYGILRKLRKAQLQGPPVNMKPQGKHAGIDDSTIFSDANSALNIALFPPLFFFSALFYTDVMSTLVVLLNYSILLSKRSVSSGILMNCLEIFVAVVALFFRQTNIFWVAIFPAGLAVIDALKTNATSLTNKKAESINGIIQESWTHGVIHDIALQNADHQDYALVLVTIAVAAIRSPLLVLKAVVPYLILLGLFASFVVWNGSVVLGDKSAHTATIHVPQMLYIWPYIAFFSAPLVAGPLLYATVPLLPNQVGTILKTNVRIPKFRGPPNLVISSFFITGALLAVHYNTIIHPYTLADNRHYVFYVFRILRRHPSIKYLAVSAYYVSAWLVTNVLGASPSAPNDDRPLEKRDNWSPTNTARRCPPCQISFIIVWLAATTLSVVTAPLVEPRYFIIPWIIWRLHIRPVDASLSTKRQTVSNSYDIRLALETVWLLALDATVIYVYLYRGFEWPSEPGKVQRFLW